MDDGKERMNAKIRTGQLEKIPYLLIVGDKEIAANAVAVRKRGGQDLGIVPAQQFTADLQAEVRERRR